MVWGSQSFDPISDLSDITGKVIVVTGSSGGIGYATIQHLARHGAKVYMAARNEDKAKAAISRLHSEGLGPGNGEVLFLKLDLSDPNDVRTAADEFMKDESRLDVLVNNAAMPRGPHAKTLYGVQDVMMTNHVGPFVLTTTLLPLLIRTARDPQSDVRIINVSSSGISFLKRGIRFRDLDDFNDEHRGELAPGLARYCRSKLANVLFTTELQKRLDAAGIPIVVMAVDPGLVRTDGVINDTASQPPVVSHIFSLITKLFWTSPSHGAHTSVFAAAAPAVREHAERYRGAYLQAPGRLVSPPHLDARNPEVARELWNTTEDLLKGMGVSRRDMGL